MTAPPRTAPKTSAASPGGVRQLPPTAHTPRPYTGPSKSDVIALRNGYHGGSPGTMGLTAMNTWKFPGSSGGAVHHAVNPDPYRSPFSGTPEEIASKSANDVRDLIRTATPGKVAAFIAE